jgi:tRNA G46 methylase TrmB
MREPVWDTTLRDNDNQISRRKRSRSKRVSAPKRMANPFSVDLTPDIGDPQWTLIFDDLRLPIHIDIGCAKGRCVELLSKRLFRESVYY